MNVKAVVKVMNFHALLRVESSKNLAQKYIAVVDELEHMMSIVLNNRNLRADRKIKLPDPSLPALKIYIGSDYGFCGSVNTAVSGKIHQDATSEKIIVGKKVKPGKEHRMHITLEEYHADFRTIKEVLEEAVQEQKWSEIYICYNHFYNLSKISLVEKKIYPLPPAQDEQPMHLQHADFVIEGDVGQLLESMTITYLVYQVRIAAASAYAAENTVRQSATTESLKKIDEMDAQAVIDTRKKKTEKEFQKTIDSCVKQKAFQR